MSRITLTREVFMLVELRALKPNPMRDFTVDPLDMETVEKLRVSIEEAGFWGGVVCRHAPDGSVQIGAGHHRIAAAIQAGIETADVFVSDAMDDAALIRVYARENATQRGNTGTAQAGSVAAAIQFIAKAVLSGVDVAKIFATSEKGASTLRGQITSEKGIGHNVIQRFLEGVPGINEGTVTQALANLKASGDYARIIREVQEEIERENAEALAALEQAERERAEAEEREREAERQRKEAAAKAKAAREEADRKRAELDRQRAEAEAKLAAKRREDADREMKRFEGLKRTRDTAAKAAEVSSKRPVTFDFEGVSKHLKNAHQIDVFRQVVTGQGIADCLPVANQAALAEQIVRLAQTRAKGELTGAFIRENVTTLVLDAKTEARQMTRDERERLQREDLLLRLKNYQREAAGGLRSFMTSGVKISELLQKWPAGLPVPISNEFRSAVESAHKVLTNLKERI